jgi:hypothetical protein
VPIHILARETRAQESALVRLLAEQPELWDAYVEFLASLHPDTLEELKAMARAKGKEPRFHLKPLIDWVGLKGVINEVGVKPVVDELLRDRAGKKLLVSTLLEQLSRAERAELKRQLEGNVSHE